MTAILLKRFVWKECRFVVPIDLAIVAVAAAIGIGYFLFAEMDRYNGMFLAGIGGLIVVGLVNGTLAFAPENDQQTIRFLRGLPIGGRQLAVFKLIAAGLPFFGLVLLAAGLLFLKWVPEIPFVADSLPQTVSGTEMYLFIVSQSLLMFVAAWLASMVCRQTLYTLVASPVLVVAFELILSFSIGSTIGSTNLFAFCIGVLVRLCLAAVGVAVGLIWLGDRWWHDWTTSSSAAAARSARLAIRFPRLLGLLGNAEFQRLHWQSWRVSFAPLAWFLGLFGLGTFWFAIMTWSALVWPSPTEGNGWPPLFFVAVIWLAAPVLFAGLATSIFWADSRRNAIRFFHQHPINAGKFWLARVVPWIIGGVIATATYVGLCQLIIAFGLGSSGAIPQGSYQELLATRLSWTNQIVTPEILPVALMFALAVAIGQFVSALFRSAIHTFFIAVAAQTLAMFVLYYLHWLDVNLLLIVGPFLAALFVCGFLVSSAWISGRRMGKAVAFSSAALLLVSGLCVGLLAWVRSNEIRWQQRIDANLAPPARFESLNVEYSRSWSDAFRTAHRLTPDERIALLTRYLDETLYAKTGPIKFDWCTISSGQEWHGANVLFDRLEADLKQAVTDQNLDRGKQILQVLVQMEPVLNRSAPQVLSRIDACITQWANLANQTPESLTDFVSFLEEMPDRFPEIVYLDLDLGAETFHQMKWNEAWKMPAKTPFGVIYRRFEGGFPFVQLFLPWERERTFQLMQLKATVMAWHMDERFSQAWSRNDMSIAESVPWIRTRSQTVTDSLQLNRFVKYEGSSPFWIMNDIIFRYCNERIQLRHFLMLKLGLIAHRLGHGSYPQSLEELRGVYRNGLPVDAITGSHFAYYPDGIPGYLIFTDRIQIDVGDSDFFIVPPDTPFVLPWSESVHELPWSENVESLVGPDSGQRPRPIFLENDYPPHDARLYFVVPMGRFGGPSSSYPNHPMKILVDQCCRSAVLPK